MRKPIKQLQRKNGEGYIDVAVTVMIVAFVLVFAVNMVSLVALNQNVKTIADQLTEYASMKGTTEIGSYAEDLRQKPGIRREYLRRLLYRHIERCFMNQKKKFIMITMALLLLLSRFALPVLAAETGDVAGAVEDTWLAAREQIKSVVNKVIFPIIDLILAVLFFVKLSTAYLDYRKHGQLEWSAPAILLATLIFSLTCPLYIWNILWM